MAEYSISRAAKLLGVHRSTLHRWIAKGVVPEPIAKEIAGSQLRYWTEDGFAKLKQYRVDYYQKKPRRKKKQRSSSK
jgi:DNA-binding transcriptional MerR regulator